MVATVALPVTIGTGGQSTKATIDATAVAQATTADVTFAYAGGATEAQLRACTTLVVSTGTGNTGWLRTSSWVIVTPPTLADAIASGDAYTVHYSAPDLFIDAVIPAPTPTPHGLAWVTADQILIHSGAYPDPAAAPPADAEWADLCAQAVSAAIDLRMTGVAILDVADFPELVVAARAAGVEAYKRREAVFGLTGYVDLQGAAIRLARDYLEGVAPLIARYATVGIG